MAHPVDINVQLSAGTYFWN